MKNVEALDSTRIMPGNVRVPPLSPELPEPKGFPDIALPLKPPEERLSKTPLDQQKPFEITGPFQSPESFEFPLVCPTCKRPFIDSGNEIISTDSRDSLGEKVANFLRAVGWASMFLLAITLIATLVTFVLLFISTLSPGVPKSLAPRLR